MKIPLDQDINLLYFGASGGFYLLHYLLLLKQHRCSFKTPDSLAIELSDARVSYETYNNCRGPSWPDYEYYLNNFQRLSPELQAELTQLQIQWPDVDNSLNGWDKKLKAILQNQWNIVDHAQWKAAEIWPSNQHTQQNYCPGHLHKIYFHCNDAESWAQYPGIKIILYTDLATQLLLAWYKQAWLFHPSKFNADNIIKTVQQSRVYQGHRVFADVVDAAESADMAIYLQDLVKNPGNYLEPVPNTDQLKFQQHWLDLHSPSIRMAITGS